MKLSAQLTLSELRKAIDESLWTNDPDRLDEYREIWALLKPGVHTAYHAVIEDRLEQLQVYKTRSDLYR